MTRDTFPPPCRIALVADPDTAGDEAWQLAAALGEQPLPGYQLELISGARDRFGRLRELEDGRYGLVHILGPGRLGVAALATARTHALPVATSYHRRIRSATFYTHGRVVVSPSAEADAALAAIGVPTDRIVRWTPAVDPERFGPAHYCARLLPGRFNLLFAGHLGRSGATNLVAEAVRIATRREPRLHVVVVGVGPLEERLRAQLGSAATFLGSVPRDLLAQIYASADLLIHPGDDAFCPAIVEAQASGLPVLAVDAPGAAALIEPGRSGCLVAADADAIAAAIAGLARRGPVLDRLATGGLAAARRRSPEASAIALADAYSRALAGPSAPAIAA